MAKRLREDLEGEVQKIESQAEKVENMIKKAQAAILTAGAEMTILQSLVNKMTDIPDIQRNEGNMRSHVQSLNNMANTELKNLIDGQGGIKHLLDTTGNLPRMQTKEMDPRKLQQDIIGAPNVAQGPQSQIAASYEKEMRQSGGSLEDYYRNILREESEQEYNGNNLNFNALRESSFLGQQLEGDMLNTLKMKIAEPIQSKKILPKLREAANDAMFEDTDMEKLSEGVLDFSNLRAFGGSDGMPLKFNSLSSGGHIV